MKTWIRNTLLGLTLVATNVGVGYYITDKLWAAVEVSYMEGYKASAEVAEEAIAMVQIASYQEGYLTALENLKNHCKAKNQEFKADDEGFWFKCGPIK